MSVPRVSGDKPQEHSIDAEMAECSPRERG